jgi:periplasmic protein TonB
MKAAKFEPNESLAPSNDGFGLALVIALAVHAFLLLAISFEFERAEPRPPEKTLDITLVKPSPKPEEPVEKPDFLAQQSQVGSGDRAVREQHTSPLGRPETRPETTPTVSFQRAGSPDPAPIPTPDVIKTRDAERAIETPPPKPVVEAEPRPSLSQLLASTQREIDRLTAELDRRSLSASAQQRRKAVNASTQEYRYASYLEAWRRKVENIGNLNYPEEARRRKLYGNLLMHVAIRSDGSVERIRVVRSSGHSLLDDAAVRIVRLAAPFAPFPPDIRDEVDVLDITRTWQFVDGSNLFSSR